MKKIFFTFFSLFSALFIADSSYGLEHMDFPKTIADVSFKDRIENLAKGYEPFKDAKSYYQIHIKQTEDTTCSEDEKNKIERFVDGYKKKGQCYVTSCADGYLPSSDKKRCECPTETHEIKDGKCQVESKICTAQQKAAISHFAEGYKSKGQCFVTSCKDGYLPSSDKKRCECPTETHEIKDDGKCYVIDQSVCTEAEKMAIPHFANGYKYQGQCHVTECTDGYEVNADSTRCECPTETHEIKDGKCEQKGYDCAAGTYLPGSQTRCKRCEKNNFCEGGRYMYSAQDQGIENCPNGMYSAVGAKQEDECHDLDRCLHAIVGAGADWDDVQTETKDEAVNKIIKYLQGKCDLSGDGSYASYIRNNVSCDGVCHHTQDDPVTCLFKGTTGDFVFDDICD